MADEQNEYAALREELQRRERARMSTGTIGPATGRERPLHSTDFTKKRVGLDDLLVTFARTVIPDIEGAAAAGDPLMGLDVGSGPLQAVTQFIVKGAPSKALRMLATKETLNRAKEMHGPEVSKDIGRLVRRYPRVSAHMDLSNADASGSTLGQTAWDEGARRATRANPIMAKTDPGYTRVPVTLTPAGLEEGGIETLAHEATHVAQVLGAPKDASQLYDEASRVLSNKAQEGGAPKRQAAFKGYWDNPFEESARNSATRELLRNEGSTSARQEIPVVNVVRRLWELAEGDFDLWEKMVARERVPGPRR